MAVSRAAWPHILHDKQQHQQQQQQRETPRRAQIWAFRQPAIFWSGNIPGWGEQVWSLVDTPGVDRNYHLLSYYFEVYYVQQGWKAVDGRQCII